MVGRAIPAAALRPARAGVLSLEPVNLAAPAALATVTKGQIAPSSTTPLQSLSSPSQASALG
jgi:hypothetical protein